MTNVHLDDLLNLLNLDTETYRQWKYFRRDVLTPVIAEINKYTDLSVTYKGVREGKKTCAVDFIVERVQGFQLSLGIDDSVETPIARQLINRGVHEKAAIKLVSRYSPDRIEASIDAYEIARSNDPDSITNSGAWLRKAIEQNWHVHEEPVAIVKSQPSVMNAVMLEEMRTTYELVRSDLAWEAFENRHSSFQTRRKNAFAKKLADPGPGMRSVASLFNSDGINHPRVRGYFMNKRLINELLGDDFETGFNKYKQEHLESRALNRVG